MRADSPLTGEVRGALADRDSDHRRPLPAAGTEEHMFTTTVPRGTS